MKEFVDVLLVDVVACISMLVGFATTLVFRYKTSVELHKGLLPGSEKDAQEDGVWYGLWTLFRKIYTIPDYPSNMGGSQTPLIDDGSNGSGSESSWPTSVIDRAGIEGVLYLRLQVFLLYLMVFLAFIGNAVLVPLNLTGQRDLPGIARTDSFNIDTNSHKFWWHVAFSTFATVAIITTVVWYRALIRNTLFTIGVFDRTPGLLAVRITGLPKMSGTWSSANKNQLLLKHLQAHFKQEHDNEAVVISAHLAPDLEDFSELMRQYDEALLAYGIAKDTVEQSEDEVKQWSWRSCSYCDPEQDAIDRLKSVADKIKVESHMPVDATGMGFATFKTAADVSQCIKDYSKPAGDRPVTEYSKQLRVESWTVERAPEPEDIIWQNQGVGSCHRLTRYFALNFVALFLIAFVVSPISYSVNLPKSLVDEMGEFGTVMAEYIPMLVLVFFVWVVVPRMLLVVSKLEGHLLVSDREDSFLRKYFAFLFVAGVLLPMLTMTMSELFKYIMNDYSHPEETAKRMYADDSGSQFMLYVMNWSLLSTPLELFQLVQVITAIIMRCCSSSSADEEPPLKPTFDYPLQYALMLHVVSVVLFFAVLAPIILVFGVLYLAIKHMVDRYMIICIFEMDRKRTMQGARQSTTATQILVVCCLLFQLGSAGFLLARGPHNRAPAIAVFALFCATFLGFLAMQCGRSTADQAYKKNLLPGELREVTDSFWLDRHPDSLHRHAKPNAGGVSFNADLTDMEEENRDEAQDSEALPESHAPVGGITDTACGFAYNDAPLSPPSKKKGLIWKGDPVPEGKEELVLGNVYPEGKRAYHLMVRDEPDKLQKPEEYLMSRELVTESCEDPSYVYNHNHRAASCIFSRTSGDEDFQNHPPVQPVAQPQAGGDAPVNPSETEPDHEPERNL